MRMHNRKTTATYLSIRFVLFFQSIFVLVFLIKEPTVLCFLSIHHNIAIFHSNNCRSNNSNKIRCRSYSKVLLSRTIATTATDRIVTSCQRSFSWQRQHQYYCNLYNHHRRRTNSFLSSASSSVSRFRRYSSIVDDNMSTASSTTTSNLRFVDIGANLLDERFISGTYRGTYRHEPDLDLIIERARNVGVKRIILTAGTIEESRAAVNTVRTLRTKYNDNDDTTKTPTIQFACTVGVHPTRCQQVFVTTGDENNVNSNDEILLQELLDIAMDGMKDNTVVAIGEIGLDYDRLEFCPADVQKKYLIRQLQTLAKQTKLPLFLHNRSVGDDLYNILLEYQDCWKHHQATNDNSDDGGSVIVGGGVAHSFDDTTELAMKFINDLGLYIGLNGCSLRTKENLQTVSEIPLNHILLETDCPYCDVRSTHAGYQYIETQFDSKAEKKYEAGKTVKNRQEPCHIIQIAEIVAKCHNVSLREVSDTCYNNSLSLFRWNKDDHDDC